MNLNLVHSPVITEKAFKLFEKKQYTFDIDPNLSKPQIKKLIEDLFNVRVIGINTHNPPRKRRRFGMSDQKKRSKRVIITVPRDQSISFFNA